MDFFSNLFPQLVHYYDQDMVLDCLPMYMKPTVYITLMLVASVLAVVDGKEAVQPDSSKKIVVFT